MDPVAELLGPRKRVTIIAREIRAPHGTVWEWKKAGSIPAWRRPAVLEGVRRLKLSLSTDAITYLAGAE